MLETIDFDERTVHLVGTAHVSADSVAEVERTIERVNPDAICVELCASRFKIMKDARRWRETDIVKVIREGKLTLLFFNLLLVFQQQKLGKSTGVAPGAELAKAVEMAEASGIEPTLVDREVGTTLKRAIQGLSFFSKMKFFSEMLAGFLSKGSDSVSEGELRELMEKDALGALVEEMGKSYPHLRKVLIDERDAYIAAKIEAAPGRNVVAVVGAGHVEGIKKNFGKFRDLAKLESVSKPRRRGKIFQWLVPLLVIGLIASPFLFGDVDFTPEVLLAWLLANGVPSAAGVYLARGHHLTALSAFLGAPLTSLTPLIGIGVVAAFVEAWFHKPKVEDFEKAGEAFSSFGKMRRNRLSRIFLVFLFSALGNMIGTFVGVSYFINLF